MAWVRLDDGFPQHPKVIGVGPLGIAMQVAGLCYANRHLTDGFIPKAAIPTLLNFGELDEHAFKEVGGMCWVIARKLIDAGIWEEAAQGYQIHDYLDYQPSRESILRERERARARRQRLHSEDVRPNVARTSGERQPNVAESSPDVRQMFEDPVPVPVPVLEGTNVPSNREAAMQPPTPPRVSTTPGPKLRKTTPHLTEAERLALHQDYDDSLGPSAVEFQIRLALDHTAATKAGKSGSWNLYVRNWLNREQRRAFHSPAVSTNGNRPAPPTDKFAAEKALQQSQRRQGLSTASEKPVEPRNDETLPPTTGLPF